MKRQKLKLKVVDHRGGEATETVETFGDHRRFLDRVDEVVSETGVHISEQTATLIHVYGQNQSTLFKNPNELTDEGT